MVLRSIVDSFNDKQFNTFKLFQRKITTGFFLTVFATILLSLISFIALRTLIKSNYNVVYDQGSDLLNLHKLYLLTEKKVAHSRAYLITRNPEFLRETEVRRQEFKSKLEGLEKELSMPEGKRLLAEVKNAEEAHHKELKRIIALENKGNQSEVATYFENVLKPLRDNLDHKISNLLTFKTALYEKSKEENRIAGKMSIAWVIIGGLISTLLGCLLTLLILRTLKEMAHLLGLLEESSKRARMILDSNIAGVLIADFSGQLLEVNQAFCYLTGWKREELLNRQDIWKTQLTPQEFLSKDAEMLEMLKKTGTSTTYDKEIIHKDGRRISVTVGAGILAREKEEYACFIIDRTQLKESEKHVMILLDELRAALKSRDLFFTLASHELRTPLTSIKLQCQTLRHMINKKKQSSVDADTVLKLTENTDSHINTLDWLIDDILDFTSISSNNLTLHHKEIDLCAICRSAIERLTTLFQFYHVPKPDMGCPKAVLVNGDGRRLEKVVHSIIVNALKYGQGSPVDVRVEADKAHAIISIKDSGKGLSSENKDRIFNKFERAISHNEVSGLGIGLYICKEIVMAHRGEIWVDSEEGKGATFFIKLPLLNYLNVT